MLQEAVLNSFTSVWCGNLTITWPHLSESARILETLCRQQDVEVVEDTFLDLLRSAQTLARV